MVEPDNALAPGPKFLAFDAEQKLLRYLKNNGRRMPQKVLYEDPDTRKRPGGLYWEEPIFPQTREVRDNAGDMHQEATNTTYKDGDGDEHKVLVLEKRPFTNMGVLREEQHHRDTYYDKARDTLERIVFLGLEDKELPFGTLLEVDGHGEGTYIGYTKKRFGANSHKINFSGNVKDITLVPLRNNPSPKWYVKWSPPDQDFVDMSNPNGLSQEVLLKEMAEDQQKKRDSADANHERRIAEYTLKRDSEDAERKERIAGAV